MENLDQALLRGDFDRLRRDLENLEFAIPKGGAKRKMLSRMARDFRRDLLKFQERWLSANEQPKSE
jgi:hypothetical protein